jgi:hypothetical protein
MCCITVLGDERVDSGISKDAGRMLAFCRGVNGGGLWEEGCDYLCFLLVV